VIASLVALKDTYIKWPVDQGVQRNIAAKFQEKRGFPGIIGWGRCCVYAKYARHVS
jgi:hypothetical protein